MVELAPALIPLFPFWQAEESFLFPPLGEWPQGEWPHLVVIVIVNRGSRYVVGPLPTGSHPGVRLEEQRVASCVYRGKQ